MECICETCGRKNCPDRRSQGESQIVVSCNFYCKQTNADRIRAMSDEELAVFLERSTGGCETCAVDCTCNGPEDLPAKAVCHQGVLKWLQQPAKEE